MSIKNILCSFSDGAAAENAARLACRIAIRNDAHVTGVFAHAMPYHYLQMDAYVPADIASGLEEFERSHEDKLRTRFMEILSEEGVDARGDFFAVRGYPNDIVADFSRTYDLTVVAQPVEDSTDGFNEPSPDTVALKAGRPVLVAPRHWDGKWGEAGAMLAWDGQRAAARAMSDAMELLERAHDVIVLHVGDEDDVRQPGKDVMSHMSRHGMTAKLQIEPRSSMSVSDTVLNLCVDSDVGLLVMGAYEHSQFAEMLIGGVTRDVVRQSHIPVLLSH